jgi:hypothetical protein
MRIRYKLALFGSMKTLRSSVARIGDMFVVQGCRSLGQKWWGTLVTWLRGRHQNKNTPVALAKS